jgi:hypothetical protein
VGRTTKIINSPLIVVPSLIICLFIMLPRFGELWSVYSSPSLVGLQTLLASPAGSAAIWAHLITFDLFVGRWIFLDARQRRIPALVTSPLLLFTVLVSPVGWAAYLILRHTVGWSARPGTEVTAPASQPVVG